MGLVCWSVSAVGRTVAVDKDGLNFLNNQTFFWFFKILFGFFIFKLGGGGGREGVELGGGNGLYF